MPLRVRDSGDLERRPRNEDANRARIYLGRGRFGAVHAGDEHGVLVLGPPRAGKTSAIVVPNVIRAHNAVVVVSTKRDVLDDTVEHRKRLGACLVFDPSGTLSAPDGVRPISWSPLSSSIRWDDAVAMGSTMVGATRPDHDRGDGAHWNERASALLSAVFHAGALANMTMADVVGAVNRHEPDRFQHALARHDAQLALDLLNGIVSTDSREQSGIWSTASSVLAGYRTAAALSSSVGELFDPDRLLSKGETLYVIAPSEQQRQMASLVAGIVRDLRFAAYREHRRTPRPSTRRTGVLLVLDELANIAPLHDLPSLVAEGASQGVVTLACLQDLSQARARWGGVAEGFFSVFGTKVVLPGIGDIATLQALSTIAGDVEVRRLSTSSGSSRFGRARTVTTAREPRLSPHAITDAPRWTAIAVIGGRVGRIGLTPHFAREAAREATSSFP